MAATVTFTLEAKQREHVVRALSVYANDLRKQVKPVEELGHQSEADHFTAEARAIDDDLKVRVRDNESVDLTKKEIESARVAIGRYVKKMHKAANTVGGLYEAETADQLRKKAERVEERTAPLFEEQQSLGLEAASIPKVDAAEPEGDDDKAGEDAAGGVKVTKSKRPFQRRRFGKAKGKK